MELEALKRARGGRTLQLEAFGDHADFDNIALTGVLTDATNGTTVAPSCSADGEDISAIHMQISALKVTTVTGS